MAVKKDNAWQHVMECAVSSSIDYQQEVPSIAFCEAEMLKASITQYISQKKNCPMSEASAIYTSCVEKALKQEKPGDKYVALAQVGSCIGVIALIVIVLTLFATHFSCIYIIFTVMAVSFIKTCNEYIRTTKLRKKAMQVWKDALQTDSSDDIKKALVQMEQVLLSKKK